MGLGITDEHRELASVVRSFLVDHDALAAAREALDAPGDAMPPFWKEIGALGWLGIHLPETAGGSGYGLMELAVIVEELGRAATPGPFLPTGIASAVIAAGGAAPLQRTLLPRLADGTGQYASTPFRADLNPRRFTFEAWARADGGARQLLAPAGVARRASG